MKRILPIFLLLAMIFLIPALSQSNHSVTLTWTWAQGAGDPATGFHVQRATVAGGPYATVGTVPTATLGFLDTSVTAGVTYFYVVTAFNPAGDSSRSPEVSCLIPFLPPSTPTGVSAVVK